MKTPTQTLDVELALAAVGRELADGVMEKWLVASVEANAAAPRRGASPPGAKKMRSVGQRTTPVLLSGGRQISLRTTYRLPVPTPRPGRRKGSGRRGKAGVGDYPRLRELGILCGATPATLSEVARQAAESSSYEQAREALSRRGLHLDEKTVVRLTAGLGTLSLQLRAAQLAQAPPAAVPGPLSGKRVVVAVDGGRLRVRQPRKRGRRRNKTGHRGFDAPWREPKVLTIYAIDETGRKQRYVRSLYDATLGDADAVFALLVGYLRVQGAHLADSLVLLGDGARWIWDRLEEFVAAVAIEPARFVAIVDYYHAVEHLGAVADLCVTWSATARRRFLRYYKRVLRCGEVECQRAGSPAAGRAGWTAAEKAASVKAERQRVRTG